MKQRLRTFPASKPDESVRPAVRVNTQQDDDFTDTDEGSSIAGIFAIGGAVAYKVSVACLSECDMAAERVAANGVRRQKSLKTFEFL
jgi:hypothetical protein